MNKQASKTTVILSVVVVALLAVGAYLWWNMTQNDTQDTITQPSVQSDDMTPETTKSESKTGPLKIYYVAIGDGGASGKKIGCDDSLVAVNTASVTTNDAIKSSMKTLLANHKKDYGQSGLYNALYQSKLTFQSSTINDDTVAVALSGTITQGGECDAPRVQAQLEQTAATAAGVKDAEITVNGTSLKDVLSLK